MNKEETYRFLLSRGISYEVTEHKAVFNMDELADVPLPYPTADAKNLFVRDDKKQHYFLITVRGDKRVDLKAFRKAHNTRPLTFASADDLLSLLRLTPGSVTPLGLLNDEERKVAFYLDDCFLTPPGLIGCHPNDNTATLWLKTADLIALIESHGNEVHLVSL